MSPCLKAALLGAVLSVTALGSAQAQVVSDEAGYAVVSTYGYAGSAIRGDYVGAPLTRFPRPDQIVPSAWGYGTYGVPTVAGIHPAPVGTPTVYVIDAPAPVVRRRVASRPRLVTRSADRVAPQPAAAPAASAGGARVVTVSVPHRQAASLR
ncbi:hypothetical protein [Methylobacterium sp. J-090]|uniref:hypothetical protein n=1 Tax=Methylobacterium sp. J-090 TaxID=2836666 RepID=UPI001FB8A374|nr:hypothetical protein [Methylobacterium sp. J-090]MCJ2080528.1 hypothetical protein [Methylobacterium sp. J-090]